VRNFISHFRAYFVHAGLFSLVINLLLLVPPLYMLQVFDRVITSRSEETLLLLTIAAVAALLVMALLEVLRARLLVGAGLALDRKLGPQVLDGLLQHTSRLSGADYLNGLRDVNTLRGFFVGTGVFALFDAPWLPIFLLIIFLFHPLLGAVAVGGALLMVALAIGNERFTRKPLERVQGEAKRAGRFIDVSVRNAEVVSALGMLPAVTRRWARMNDGVLREQMEASALGGTFSGLTKFSRQLIQMAMLGAGAWLVIAQDVTPGVMMAATIILGRALAPVETLVASWRSLVEAKSAWRRLDQLLESTPPAQPGTKLPAPAGELVLERVAFSLRGSDRPIIRGVSLRLAAGEALGMVGPSASGKSTLARLMVGVWRPVSGAVRLDGADVSTWPREQLGPHVGYLPQDVELFAGTVAENIARLGEPDASEVIRAAQRAHVHELILRLPKGYDSDIGDAGQSLSPGQRQRIALARALYGRPRLVVLDEPNANLDNDGDEALVRTLRVLREEGATVVIIAHRPSLIAGVDKILVLREGAAELFGPRAEVMARITRAAPARGVA
jgi:PrtD family type I secretion system ABC transporter